MIYLIDEKKIRQGNYNWDQDRLAKYEDVLIPIYQKSELDEIKEKIYASADNIVLFHDSFFDDPKNTHPQGSESIKQKLLNIEDGPRLVIFSGSKSNRYIKNANYASMHVSWVYQNLDFFLEKYMDGDINLKYLAFGENYEYEEVLELRNDIWESLYYESKDSTLNLKTNPKKDLNNLLKIANAERLSGKLVESNNTVGYFKHRLNALIKEALNE
jgi:hypothetical protein